MNFWDFDILGKEKVFAITLDNEHLFSAICTFTLSRIYSDKQGFFQETPCCSE